MPVTSSDKPKLPSPKSLAALADYLAMGPARSLGKLVALYKQVKQNGSKVPPPSVSLKTITKWSWQHGWQAEVRKYEAGIAETKLTEAQAARNEWRGLIDEAKAELRRCLEEKEFIADRVKDLADLAKLEFQILGEPLVDAVRVDANLEVTLGALSSGELKALLADLAGESDSGDSEQS